MSLAFVVLQKRIIQGIAPTGRACRPLRGLSSVMADEGEAIRGFDLAPARIA